MLIVNINSLILLILVCGVHSHAQLGASCKDDWDCNNIVDAECANGTCNCISDAVPHEGACVQLSQPETSCTLDNDCKQPTDERKICVNNKCRCLPIHHVLGGVCTKNRGLHESCTSDNECYWGRDMLDVMDCIGYKCSCKSGYRPFNGRKCISGANAKIPQFFLMVSVVVAVFKLL